MKRLTFLFIILIAFISQLYAQNMDEWVSERKQLLFEKLYLQVDRELYAPGDKIRLKVYQVNGINHQLNANFRNIFVQLVDDKGHVANDLLLFSINGQAQGTINTDYMEEGMYTLRAFTKYLDNFGEEAYFHKNIWISKAKLAVESLQEVPAASLVKEVSFLPEGGLLVLNAPNMVAFKGIDEKGKGVEVSGKIIDDLGDSIVAFKSTYRGMGKLTLMPVDDRSYYALIDQNPGMKIQLTTPVAGGINLSYRDNEEFILITMSSNMKGKAPAPFYFMASRKGNVLYRKIRMTDFTYSLHLSKDLFSEGISKITLLDTLMHPFAERLIYVNKGEKDLVSLHLDKKEYNPREKVSMEADALLAEGDSITSPLSITVVNRDYLGEEGNSQTIKSYLLLDSELKGGIEYPASYFTNDAMPSAQKLDLLMMVNGWRSYIWDDVEAIKAPVEDWNDAGIEIKGYVKKLIWKASLSDAQVSLSYVFKNYEIGKAITDEQGRFSFDRIFFQDSTKLMLNGHTKQGTRNLEIVLDPPFYMDSIVELASLRKSISDITMNMKAYQANLSRQQKELAFNPEKGIILLDQVDILGDSKQAFSRSMGEYPWADETFKVKPADRSYAYLIDYLMDKIPSLETDNDSVMGYKMANRPVDFLVDNLAPMDLRELSVMRMDNVDMVDVLKPGFRSATPGALGVINPNGLIAIYSINPNRVSVNYTYKKGRIRPEIRGYHKPVKFYSPTYTPENIDSPQPDFRPTLLWNPELNFQGAKANIEFFTCDDTARYVVFVEGITKNGGICYGTTDFVVNKK